MKELEPNGRHPIQVVARRTGLTAELLRVWEKRYGAVRPSRTSTGRRLYSDADLERLTLLRQATRGGRRIGEVSQLSTAALRTLVEEDRPARDPGRVTATPPRSGRALEALEEDAMRAIESIADERLEAILGRALLVLPAGEVIEGLLVPILHRIGTLWREGRLAPYHEHAATVVIRRVVGQAIAALRVDDAAPSIATATPAGEHHDVGALLAGFLAAASGWRVVNLGADLPASDIARAAREVRVDAVALSLVHPAGVSALADELRALREHLEDGVPLIVGGAAVQRHMCTLQAIGAIVLADLRSLGAVLDAIGRGRRAPHR